MCLKVSDFFIRNLRRKYFYKVMYPRKQKYRAMHGSYSELFEKDEWYEARFNNGFGKRVHPCGYAYGFHVFGSKLDAWKYARRWAHVGAVVVRVECKDFVAGGTAHGIKCWVFKQQRITSQCNG